MTNNRIKGVLLGAGVTAVIQSSSAVTVMAVGFVNSGIMALNQVVGIIMGANIGTCITSWLLSLTGIESSNVFLTMLKPSTFSPILALIGIVLYMFCKSEKKKELGSILLGFYPDVRHGGYERSCGTAGERSGLYRRVHHVL